MTHAVARRRFEPQRQHQWAEEPLDLGADHHRPDGAGRRAVGARAHDGVPARRSSCCRSPATHSGTQSVPPNQVLAGLALILSLFIMAPVMSAINHVAIQPYEHGQLTATQAIDLGEVPLEAVDAEADQEPRTQPVHLLPSRERQEPRIAAADDGDPGVRALGDPDRLSRSGS